MSLMIERLSHNQILGAMEKCDQNPPVDEFIGCFRLWRLLAPDEGAWYICIVSVGGLMGTDLEPDDPRQLTVLYVKVYYNRYGEITVDEPQCHLPVIK